MRSVPSLYRLTRHYIYNKMRVPSTNRDTIYNKMRSVPSLYRLTKHYIYNKMRAVPTFIDTGHYIYNKMRSVRDTIFTIK